MSSNWIYEMHLSKWTMKTLELNRRLQVSHKHVHAFIKVNDVSMIP